MKPWERPWTTSEIIESAENWSLAGDVALLNALKAFSNNLLTKTNEINSSLHSLTSGLEEANVQLNIAQAEFQGLRSSQFIESRVYEDDETLPEVKKAEETDRKEDPVEEVRLAALKGLEVLEKYYEKVEVSVSDSEDEDIDLPNFVLRPKDPYIDRPLPYVIGSAEWNRSYHVGLEDSDSETEKVSDNYSESTDSESELPTVDRSQIKDSDSEIDFPTAKVPRSGEGSPTAIGNFAEELAAKLSGIQEPEVNTRPIQKQQYGEIFFDEPPPLDEPQGPFSGGKGLFDDDEPGGLFDDEIETAPSPPPAEDRKKPVGGVSILGGGNIFDKKLLRRQPSSDEDQEEVDLFKDDLFTGDVASVGKTANLFDDDLFKAKQEPVIPVQEPVVAETKKVSLFDDNLFQDDLFSTNTTQKFTSSLFDDIPSDDIFSDEKHSINQSRLFDSPPPDDVHQSERIFDSPPPDDLFSQSKAAKSSSPRLFDSPPPDDLFSQPKDDKPPSPHLFDSPERGAFNQSQALLFDSPPPDDAESKPRPSLDSSPPPKEPIKVGRLKHDLKINVGALMPGSLPPKPAPKNQFDETDRVEVLHSVTKDRAKVPLNRRPSTRRGRKAALKSSPSDFKLDEGSDMAETKEHETNEESTGFDKQASEKLSSFDKREEKEPRKQDENEESEQKKEDNLFDSCESEDLFRETSRAETKEKRKMALFDDDDDDDDLFGAQTKENVGHLFDKAQPTVETSRSIFDDDDDDLFTSKKPVLPTVHKKSLFDDEDGDDDDIFKEFASASTRRTLDAKLTEKTVPAGVKKLENIGDDPLSALLK